MKLSIRQWQRMANDAIALVAVENDLTATVRVAGPVREGSRGEGGVVGRGSDYLFSEEQESHQETQSPNPFGVAYRNINRRHYSCLDQVPSPFM